MKGRQRPGCIHSSYIGCLLAARRQFLLHNGCGSRAWLGGRGALAVFGDGMHARLHCGGKRGGAPDTWRTLPPAQSSGTAALREHIKSKTQRRPCSTCRAQCRGYGGIHQSASAARDINYPEPRSISPQSALSFSMLVQSHFSQPITKDKVILGLPRGGTQIEISCAHPICLVSRKAAPCIFSH